MRSTSNRVRFPRGTRCPTIYKRTDISEQGTRNEEPGRQTFGFVYEHTKNLSAQDICTPELDKVADVTDVANTTEVADVISNGEQRARVAEIRGNTNEMPLRLTVDTIPEIDKDATYERMEATTTRLRRTATKEQHKTKRDCKQIKRTSVTTEIDNDTIRERVEETTKRVKCAICEDHKIRSICNEINTGHLSRNSQVTEMDRDTLLERVRETRDRVKQTIDSEHHKLRSISNTISERVESADLPLEVDRDVIRERVQAATSGVKRAVKKEHHSKIQQFISERLEEVNGITEIDSDSILERVNAITFGVKQGIDEERRSKTPQVSLTWGKTSEPDSASDNANTIETKVKQIMEEQFTSEISEDRRLNFWPDNTIPEVPNPESHHESHTKRTEDASHSKIQDFIRSVDTSIGEKLESTANNVELYSIAAVSLVDQGMNLATSLIGQSGSTLKNHVPVIHQLRVPDTVKSGLRKTSTVTSQGAQFISNEKQALSNLVARTVSSKASEEIGEIVADKPEVSETPIWKATKRLVRSGSKAVDDIWGSIEDGLEAVKDKVEEEVLDIVKDKLGEDAKEVLEDSIHLGSDILAIKGLLNPRAIGKAFAKDVSKEIARDIHKE
eukprot:TRINITY_DN2401_c0_g2_i1.p1 TRINITY_DN2401_c0_g2~~TRINITY_DN2401_c0_g2_i1.p1  ORF type:complete len:616 (+),score=113.26 TRINITY_DN2401_c0_g2_i1:82-1929(+)